MLIYQIRYHACRQQGASKVIYIGAWLFKILYTNINNLKTMLSLTGNQ